MAFEMLAVSGALSFLTGYTTTWARYKVPMILVESIVVLVATVYFGYLFGAGGWLILGISVLMVGLLQTGYLVGYWFMEPSKERRQRRKSA